ncbi:magnesium transporter [Corynebacterium ulceribovis]|uniref:magnesium transporter n=1 Tax=Corynebacterium ulceribovis TaxID=487732 RepID=UPI00036050B9|nr:magnesium transporter [Corynebacterium ulceribovis]
MAQVIILAAFIPPIIDMGGNAGSQSATLVLRAMALGQVRVTWREIGAVIARELPVGVAIAVTVSVLEVALASMTKHSALFSDSTETGVRVLIVVGLSMMICTVLGALIGALLPFLAKKIGADPATLSSPLITSIMDITGVLIYFGLAMIFLGHLLVS